jgi:hypothetical protein
MKDALVNTKKQASNLADAQKQASNWGLHTSMTDAQKQASNCGLDTSRLEALLQAIEQKLIQRSLSDKYKAMFYLAATGLYSAEDLAERFNHSHKNLNADFNKNLGVYLKFYLELDDDERVGITSLRRILFRKGYCVHINDDNLVNILPNRYSQNRQQEAPSTEVVLPSEE